MSEREEKLKTLLKNIKESDPPSLMALIMAFSQEWQEIMNMSKEKLSEEEDKIVQEILREYDQKHFDFIEAWEKGKFQPNQQEMSMLEKIYLNIEPIFKQADEYESGQEFKNLSEDDKKKARKSLEKIKKYKPILEKLLKKNGLLSSSSETPSSNEMIIDMHGDSDGNKANDGKQLSSPKPSHDSALSNPKSSPPNPKKPTNTPLIVAISLLVVAILAIGLIVFMPYFKSSKDKKSKKVNGKEDLSKTRDISEKDETITITEVEKKDKKIPTPKKKKEKTKS